MHSELTLFAGMIAMLMLTKKRSIKLIEARPGHFVYGIKPRVIFGGTNGADKCSCGVIESWDDTLIKACETKFGRDSKRGPIRHIA
jgi:hypothetical protein